MVVKRTYRAMLWLRREPNGNHRELGLTWWEWSRFQRERFRSPLLIAFAFVATHNHFVLDRGGKVFKQSAPIIKLPETATEDDHYALLAYLNSSTACFWMKQVFYPKGSAVRDAMTPENNRYEFAGAGLQELPLPPGYADGRLAALARTGVKIVERRANVSPSGVLLDSSWFDRDSLGLAIAKAEAAEMTALRELVFVQEEIYWLVYAMFGLVPVDAAREHATIAPEERPFAWEGSAVSEHVAPCVRELFERRRRLIETDSVVAQLETRSTKRLWRGSSGESGRYGDDYAERFRTAALVWLASQLEQVVSAVSLPTTAVEIASVAQKEARIVAVASHCSKHSSDEDVSELTRAVLSRESVPYLSSLTYTSSGIEKRDAWNRTWDLQRREDRGQGVPVISKPPEYSQGSRGKPKDFQEDTYWDLRGKLDVPKERFISYPGCESEDDKSPVYGWAGWNHLQRAQALAGLYQARKDEGWEAPRLLPMLVGLIELLPWLHQYHGEPDESLGGDRPADQFEAFVAEELRLAGKTREQAEREVLAWAQQRGGGAQRKARPARSQLNEPLESGADADESALDSESASAPPSSRAALKPPTKAKARSKSKPANDVDANEAVPGTKVARRRGKGGSR